MSTSSLSNASIITRPFSAPPRLCDSTFLHLHLHTPYSLLDGGSSIEDLVRTASKLGMPALACTDHNSLAASVKFVERCKKFGIKPILGAEITMEDDSHLTLLCRNTEGYANLAYLISIAWDQGERLIAHLPWESLEGNVGGLICLSGCRKGRIPTLVRECRMEEAKREAEKLRDLFRDGFYVELQEDYLPQSWSTNRALVELGREIGVPVVATNNVHYARPEDAIAHDVLRCIATKTTVEEIAEGRPLNDQRYLKSAREMAELFHWCPEAIENTIRIAESCEVALPKWEDVTPHYPIPEGMDDADQCLREAVMQGAYKRYGQLDQRTWTRIDHELNIIYTLRFADYFLMVKSVVDWARSQGILATGRGSAADSCVAYCLRLTDVDVLKSDLPFARFLTPGKLPDIDIDFPSDRRDEVFEYVRDTFGVDNVAMVCTWATFRAKSAVRDVGKALGLPEEILKFLSDHLSHFIRADRLRQAFETQPELKPFLHLQDRFELLFTLCAKIANFPRHIATHSSGIVISRVPIAHISPLQHSAKGIVRIMQLDKDDAEEMHLIKFDVLALRTLGAVVDAERNIQRFDPDFRYDTIPLEDDSTFEMLRAGQAIGVFQLESPAQMALAAMVDYDSFWDLVCAVALIRPGPVAGEGVSRFIATRNGWAKVDFLHPALQPVLERTLGCVVFQEQVIGVVSAMTGCDDATADRFRKSLAKHVRNDTMDTARTQFIRAALRHHRDLTFERAGQIFSTIQAWHGYGFTEGHAHSFAITAWKTASLSNHHPAAFFAALMSHQPMGYYSANTLAGEARRRGIDILPVDINESGDKCIAVTPKEIRLGFRLVQEIRAEEIQEILEERAKRPFASLLDFCARVPLPMNVLENLVLAGAFEKLHDHRRGLLWRLPETVGLALAWRRDHGDVQERLDYGPLAEMETPVAWEIPDLSLWDRFMWTWRITGVTAEAHVFAHVREALNNCRYRILTTDEALNQPVGTRVIVAGLNIRPHRPPTRSGRPVLFSSLEDETGYLQAIVSDEAIETCTATFLTAPVVLVGGIITRRGRGIMFKVTHARPLNMNQLIEMEQSMPERLHEPIVIPNAGRSYPGTKLGAQLVTA